jgi:hypothetical protein
MIDNPKIALAGVEYEIPPLAIKQNRHVEVLAARHLGYFANVRRNGDRGRAKGPNGGIDCAQIIAIVFAECGLCPLLPLTEYSPDFFLHRGVERYMSTVLTHCREVATPQPGDIALFKVGRLSALVCLVCGISIDTFRKCSLLKLVNRGEMLDAAAAFTNFVYVTDDAGRRIIDEPTLKHRELQKDLFLKPELVRRSKRSICR